MIPMTGLIKAMTEYGDNKMTTDDALELIKQVTPFLEF